LLCCNWRASQYHIAALYQLAAGLTCNVFRTCQDHELAPMHGVKLFKDFVEKKETRRPEVTHPCQLFSEDVMALMFDCFL